MILGLISDTHGLLRPEAIRALTGADQIIHAGDIGDPRILAELHYLAPVVAVRGNIDKGDWAQSLPLTTVWESEAANLSVYVLHDLHELDLDPEAAGFRIVVSGHSHQPSSVERGGVLYVNPGSAGPRRFRLPVTIARLNLNERPLRMQLVDLLQP